MSEFVFI